MNEYNGQNGFGDQPPQETGWTDSGASGQNSTDPGAAGPQPGASSAAPESAPPSDVPPTDGTPAGDSAQPFSFDPGQYAQGAPGSAPQPTPPRRKGKGVVVFGAILCCVVALAGIIIGAGYIYKGAVGEDGTSSRASSSGGVSINDKPDSGSSGSALPAAGEKLTTEQVAAKLKPSVVGIATYNQAGTVEASSYGSGIIISEDGYIVTNAHVVSGAIGVTVTLNNGEDYSGTVIGTDAKTDLAVVKIEAKNLTPAELGNSDQMEVGEQVAAVGNPGGPTLAGSVTYGYVSAINRQIASTSGAYSMNCIQTDAAINPGNSGGALANMYGQVVGINSSKIAATDYEGIGFAIAINDAKPIIDSLMQNGYVKDRVKLGISVTEINETLAKINDLPQGLYIKQINPGGSMDGVGVQVGDVITKVNGTDITSFDDLQNQLKGQKPGDKIKMTIYRKSQSGADKTFEVVVELQEDTGASSAS
ncbi:Serine protease Do-like HtrA [Anaerotruncus sp. 2789STDY5834896]|uniref:Serine protease Do-like HtrA n=1 Tax=uncultured Anaerotruncus sp. TaxID=905011 RepID=A0A1C6JGE9_9FIRM|nr:Serine protease Do-like HtrA [uncultured Anaerotruncus sp.]